MSVVAFRDYRETDRQACVAIFDKNCPEFFAPNEKDDYLEFLGSIPTGYKVCLIPSGVVGAFGVFPQDEASVSLNWILLDPETQGLGIGTKIMAEVLFAARTHEAEVIHIAASHKSAPFFERFGAFTAQITEHGWGTDMHRVDMEVRL